MALDLKPRATVREPLHTPIKRDAARKTLARLVIRDKAVRGPLAARRQRSKELPKRRRGRVWTTRATKDPPTLNPGAAANVKITPQAIKDLNSVADFIEVK